MKEEMKEWNERDEGLEKKMKADIYLYIIQD